MIFLKIEMWFFTFGNFLDDPPNFVRIPGDIDKCAMAILQYS